MPAGTVANQDGTRARCDLGADFRQMQIHHLRVGDRREHRRPHPALRADGAKDAGGIMAVIAHHQRARAHRRPDIGVASLLADAGFVLEPDFYRCAGRGAFERLADQVGKVS